MTVKRQARLTGQEQSGELTFAVKQQKCKSNTDTKRKKVVRQKEKKNKKKKYKMDGRQPVVRAKSRDV